MLEIQDLHVKFHNRDREAVSGVSLTIQDGEILGLVGESGSGKSVTAMSVAGLLPRKRCDYTGRILLDGQELLHADRSVLREIQGAEIGVVFQEPQSCMDPLMKIGPQVEETLRIHTQMPKEERHQRALAAMAAAELPDPFPRAEKQKWFDTLCAVQNEISARLHACYVGKTLRCLVDGETDDARWPLSARTAGGRLVHLVGDKSALGQYRDIKITDSNTWALFGEMV